MNSPTRSVPDNSPKEIIKRVADLYATRAQSDFGGCVEALTTGLFGDGELTLVVISAGEYKIRYSAHLSGVSRRLSAPVVDSEEAERAIAWRPDDGGAVPTVTIDGAELPVHLAWRLPNPDGEEAFLLFHDEAVTTAMRSDSMQQQLTDQVQRSIQSAYAVVAEHSGLKQRTDLLQAKMAAINDIGELLGSTDLEVLLTKLLELSLYVVEGQVGSILLVRDGDGVRHFDCPIEWGLPLEFAECFRTSEGAVIFESVLEHGEVFATNDFGCEHGCYIDGQDVHVDSYLCVPLVSKNGALGVVNIVNSGGGDMDREIVHTICGLAATSIENAMLYQDSLEKERYQESLKIARQIQRRLYPAAAPQIPALDIASRTESCDETGGDYYDYLESGEDKDFVVVIGDVSGHGIGAALHMVAARAALRASLSQGLGMTAVLGHLNNHLEQDMEIEHFMTMFVGCFPEGKPLTYVNAGHDAPSLYRAERDEIEDLGSTGIPLGLFPDHPYTLGEVDAMEPGDVFLAMTDGVWEVLNPTTGEMLGKDRLTEIFHELARTQDTADDIANGILAAVAEFTNCSPARDDVTLLVIRVRD